MAGTTLAQGSSVTLTLAASDSILIDSGAGGSARIEAVSGVGGAANQAILAVHPGGQATYGPFGAGTVKLNAVGGVLAYMQGAAPLVDEGGYATFGVGPNGVVRDLKSNGATVAYVDTQPGDWMRKAGGVGQISAAISTTVVASQAIPVASTRVRVAWQSKGSAGSLAGTERLYIAANEDNAVAGLIASQDVRRRLYTLAPGEAVVLTSKAPITVLHFSASASVSANFHSIDTAYEEVAA